MLALCIPLGWCGCAGVSHRSIDDLRADRAARGFRYYEASPYLLVQTDNAGGLKSELKWLPDRTKLRQATPYKFLAKNEATFEFANGVLSKSDSVGDGTAIPNAFIQAAEKVASAAIKAGALDDPRANADVQPTAPRVYLFKIVKLDGAWTLLGASGIEPLYQTKVAE
jgi:hypothetical protein